MSSPDDPDLRDLPEDDDAFDPGPVPGPDDEPSPAERARARAFGELLDKVVAGRAPAAMPAEDRPLVEAATVIRAATGRAELSTARRDALVESALARAMDRLGGTGPAPTGEPEHRGGAGGGGAPVIPLASRAWRRRAPWLVAAVSTTAAVAAALLLMLRPARAPIPAAPVATAAPLPLEQRSRPADPMIGAISREHSGDAAARIDAIFADRLDGFRAHTLAPPSRRGSP